MLSYFFHIAVVVFFSLALLGVSFVLGHRSLVSRNKNTSFECGFDPKESARLPFSMRFFLLAVIFLIFDIEVALLFPSIWGLALGFYVATSLAVGGFLLILVLGLWHEWNQGSLSWVL